MPKSDSSPPKMKIAFIAAGAAGMYCGSCLRDNALAKGLMELGHDVALLPTYTPLRVDEKSVSTNDVFMGGINIYLQHKYRIFRSMPRFVDKMLDNPGLLKWVSKKSMTTNAEDLGGLTISTLMGEIGPLKKEVLRLASWLGESYKPDIVLLTNSMFSGLAAPIKRATGVPVLCAMQGEDLFLDGLTEPWKSKALQRLRKNAADVDAFIATSAFYADFMEGYLDVPGDKIHIAPIGINLEGHGGPARKAGTGPKTIGYLARICPEKGLHILLEAFRILVSKQPENDFVLKVAGYLGTRDVAYFEECKMKVEQFGLQDKVVFVGEVEREPKIEFLQKCDVLCVPTVYKEPKGLFVLEALANGTPVVLPAHGAFPELVEKTGGGILVEPGSPEKLADALLQLLHDDALRDRLGMEGKRRVQESFSNRNMAAATAEIFRTCCIQP